MIKFHIVPVVCALALLCACDQKKQEKKGLPPAQTWQSPTTSNTDQTNPHAGMQGQNPHAGMQGQNPHAGMQGQNPHAGMQGQNPHAGTGQAATGSVDVTALGLQPPDPNRAIDQSKFLKGTIKPTATTKSAIPQGAVIYLSVKRADPNTGNPIGTPLAVKRLRLSTWPMWFQLNEADAMVDGTQLKGDVVITAWADQDEDAMTKSPGDVLGITRATIPSKDLIISLDRVL